MSTIERALQRLKQKEQGGKEPKEGIGENETLAYDSEPVDSLADQSLPKVQQENDSHLAPPSKNDTSSQHIQTTYSGKQSALYMELALEALEEKGFVSVQGKRLIINEEFRAIKRKIIENAFGPLSKTLENSNVIMVSSSKPNEGKTFTAINLALSIASEQDKTVLLVDADVLKPSIMKVFELPANEGLMEYLLGEKDSIADVMYRTNIEKLRVVPAGRTHHLSAELLASTRMKETIEEFSTRYPDRVVIIDTPPLLGINESVIMANLAGQAVIVAEEGKSRLSDITKAISYLNEDMAKGFVVNKSRNKDGNEGYYGYYYGAENVTD